jgi:hypothetical protein
MLLEAITRVVATTVLVERDDAIAGIAAVCALIGSVVLFSKGKAAVVAS